MKIKTNIKAVLLLGAVASVGLSNAATTVHNGLLSYWALDGSGADTAASFAGNASTVADDVAPVGTMGAATISSSGGLFGGAGVFERTIGVDGRLAVAESADTIADGENLTISLWTQFDDQSSGNWQAILSKGENSNYRIATNRGGAANNASGVAGGADINSGVNVRDGGGAWHHILVTHSTGADTQIWVDGTLSGTATNQTISSVVTGNDFIIGNNVENLNRMWDGQIDDVAIWDRPLTAAEIGEIHTEGLAGTPLGDIVGIPEPSSGILLGLSGLLLAVRRRR